MIWGKWGVCLYRGNGFGVKGRLVWFCVGGFSLSLRIGWMVLRCSCGGSRGV